MTIIVHGVCYITKCCHTHKQINLGLQFDLPTNKQPTIPTTHMLTTKLTTEQKVKVTLTPTTATGLPAKLDGKPQWKVVTGEGDVEVEEDGMSAFLVSSDLPGVTEFLVVADADIGSGTEEIAAAIVVETVGAHAKNLGLTLGEPVAKNPPKPPEEEEENTGGEGGEETAEDLTSAEKEGSSGDPKTLKAVQPGGSNS